MSDLSLVMDNHSFSSSSILSIISVPRPRVFPRGSGNISKDSPEDVEVKVFCVGLGLDEVAGGRDETLTEGDTRKLHEY